MRMGNVSTGGRLGKWIPCAALALGSVFAVGVSSIAPRPGGPIAAIYPPWWSATRSFIAAASGGMPVRFGATDFVVVVMPETDDAAHLLRQAGAWLLLDPKMLGGCSAS